jgi:hypothetical protein
MNMAVIIITGILIGAMFWIIQTDAHDKQVCYNHNYTGLQSHYVNSKDYVCYNTIIENGTKINRLGIVSE